MGCPNLPELLVELTNRCSLNCIHCSSKASPHGKQAISSDTFSSMLLEGRAMGVRMLTLSGGEPLYHPKFFDFVALAGKLDLSIRIYTSGVLGPAHDLQSIEVESFAILKGLGVDSIIISIQGGEPGVHDLVTSRRGSFVRTIESARRAISAGLRVEAHLVPTKLNWHQIEQVANLCRELGCEELSLLRLVVQGRASAHREILEMSPSDLSSMRARLVRLGKQAGKLKIRLGAPMNFLRLGSPTGCMAGRSKLLISSDGKAYPCEAFKTIYGPRAFSVNRTSLRHIWINDPLINRLRLLDGRRPVSCGDCPQVDSCSGGCPAQRMLLKDVDEGDPACFPEYEANKLSEVV
ncbi:MAG: radical SAM protein [Actinobacteria bacterium]|nr:radical SAM protein [Actinomycetota bacterium]